VIPFDDRGLLLGDGLFETVLALDGVLQRWPAHMARLAAGCATLGLPAPDIAEAETLARGALWSAQLQKGRAAVRLTLTAGSGGRGLDRTEPLSPRLFATAAASPAPTGPARLITSTVRRNAGSPAARLKTLAYLDNVLARREARAAGSDEAVMLNGAGEVACAAAANLFWLADGRLFTPSLECGVLAGVARAAVLAAAPGLGLEIAEVRAGAEAARGAEAVFLTSSLIGARAVGDWDGRGYAANAMVARIARAIG
jgi:branched-subunit amino acid aminotransferase/4-amino-4-deoxychorismate lyase